MVETRMILQTRQTPFRAVTGDIWYFTVRAPAARSVWRNRFSKHSIAISWKWNRKHLMKAIIMGCSTVHRKNWLLSVRGIIRRLKLRLKISATMISCLSAIRFGMVAWPRRCRRSCIIMLRNLQVSVSLFLPAVAAAASLHQLTRRERFAPVPLSPKHCF